VKQLKHISHKNKLLMEKKFLIQNQFIKEDSLLVGC